MSPLSMVMWLQAAYNINIVVLWSMLLNYALFGKWRNRGRI